MEEARSEEDENAFKDGGVQEEVGKRRGRERGRREMLDLH
jgi:hypothetical protein